MADPQPAPGLPGNLAALLVSRGLVAAAGVVTLGILYRRLGSTEFGVWALLTGLCSILTLLDLGLGSAGVRAVAADPGGPAAGPTARPELLSRTVRLLLLAPVWACVLVGSGLLLTALLGPWLGGLVGLGDALRQQAQVALALLLLALLSDQLVLPWRCALEGRQHYRPLSLLTASSALLLATAAILTVLAGGRLVALAAVTATLVMLRCVAVVVLARALAPRLPIADALPRPRAAGRTSDRTGDRSTGWTKDELCAVTRYGLPVQITSLTGVVNLEADRFVLGGLVGPATVGGFEAGARWASVIRLIPTYALTALFPLAARRVAELDAEAGRRWLNRMHRLTGRYLAVTAGTGAALLVGCAPEVVRLTLGRVEPVAVVAIRVLAVGYAINLVSGATAIALRVCGRPGRETRYALLAAVVNLALTYPLFRWFGAVGVPLATTVGTVLGTAWFLLGRGAGDFRLTVPAALDLGRPLVAAAVGATLALVLVPTAPGTTDVAVSTLSTLSALSTLLLRAGLVLAGTAAGLVLLGFFDADERARWGALRDREAWLGVSPAEVRR